MRWIVAILAVLVSANLALADDSTSVSVLNVYKAAEPFLLTLFSILATAIVGWLAAILKSKWGVDLDAHAREAINTAATNAAGSLIAKMEGPIGTSKIDVKSPLVKEGVDMVIAKVPDAIAHFGGADKIAADLAAIVQAKLGLAQAGQTVPAQTPS